MRFYMRYVDRPADSYYHTRWDLSTPIEILAKDYKEAEEKLLAVLGEPSWRRIWNYTVDKIIEQPQEL